MNIDKEQLRKILMIVSIAALGIIFFSALLLVNRAVEPGNDTISMEMVKAAYAKLQARYGEKNFPSEAYILNILYRELNIYNDSIILEQGFANQDQYKEMIIDTLERNGVFKDFFYIAFVQSFSLPEQYDQAKAMGLWQLLPSTARSFGLRVTETVDERIDPDKSSLAAARYLRHLQEYFGTDSFTLVLAAYKAGESNILNSALKAESSISAVSFWDLYSRDLVTEETRTFVIRTITFLILGEGLLPPEESEPGDAN